MSHGVWRNSLMLSVACLALAPGLAQADTSKQQELEARIAALEATFGAMQSELASTKAENAALRQTLTQNQTQIAQLTAPPVSVRPTAPPPDGFTAGGGATRIKFGGFIKTVSTFSRWDDGDVAANTFGRDFYLPQAIPIGGVRESIDNDFAAKQTRLWMNIETQIAGHTLKGYVETDFQTAPGTQGSERTTNGYDLALRRAFLQFDKLTVGQDWTTFQNTVVLPETTDFVGPTEGTVFARQPLVRYSMPLNPRTTLHVSLENPETASANLGTPALIENDDDRVPDLALRINHTGPFGEVSLAGLVRQLEVDNGLVRKDATGYGASLAAKLFLDKAKRYDLRFMATYGVGIGRYVGLNFAPDTVFVPGTNTLAEVESTATFAALRLGWTPKLRSTVMVSFQDTDYDRALSRPLLAGFNKSAMSYAGNLFWSPVAGLDLGVELRHGQREVVSGAKGQFDRVEFVAKYGF